MININEPCLNIVFEECPEQESVATLWSSSCDEPTTYNGDGGMADNVILTWSQPLYSVYNDGITFTLDHPLTLFVTHKDSYYQFDCADLSIYSAGKEFKEALESFSEDFAFTWREYAEETDVPLSGDARKLKSWLLNHVQITV